MKRPLLLVFTLILLLLTNAVFAAVRVDTLYEAKVPVASQAAEERAKALPTALAQVMIKVNGNSHVMDNPKLKADLNTANSLMQAFGYASSGTTAKPYLLDIQFDPEGVNKLFRDTATPIWGVNRPLILAWVECKEKDKPAEIVDSSSEGVIQKTIKAHAEQRGLPLILPMMDVTDLDQVSVNDIVNMNVDKLQSVSERYASDAILIVHVFELSDGFSLQSKLVMGKDVWTWNITGKSKAAILNTLIDNITDTLAGRYATVVSNTVQDKVKIKVTGVAQQNDFDQMLRYMQHLPSVAAVQVVKVEGSDVTLEINLRATRSAFMKTISDSKKLIPVSDNQQLVYQWGH
ncbi:MAG: DUF2066 domain-containing protein [Gammaproteobacteria bacterium]